MTSKWNLIDVLEYEDRPHTAQRTSPTRCRETGPNAWARYGHRSHGLKSFDGRHRRSGKKRCA